MATITTETTTHTERAPKEYSIRDALRSIQVDKRSARWREGKLYESEEGLVEALRKTARNRLIRREEQEDEISEYVFDF